MSTTALAKQSDAGVIEKVILGGDLKELKPEERLSYYNRVCESLGLNPLTQPFAYMNLSGKLTLYARKDAAEQLRKVNEVSLDVTSREVLDGMYVVTCAARTPTGRTDASTGVIDISGLKGEAKANAMMKAETKAKRRVTLSICGLGLIDETEVDSVAGARKVSVHDAHSHKLLEDGGAKVQGSPAPAATDRPIPEELELCVAGLRRGDTSWVKSAMDSIKAQMTELGIGKAWDDRAAGLRSSYPKGTTIPTAVTETFLLDVFEALEKARSAKAEPSDKPKETDAEREAREAFEAL